VRSRVSELGDARQSIAALNEVLFGQEDFRGNTDDYYDPRNSFLNEVLDRKLGIPITLSLVYMEVARRVGFPLVGVGMPGHFLLKHYDVEGRSLLIDPFDAGAIVSAYECRARFEGVHQGQLEWKPEYLVTVSSRQMLTRILNNLRSIYMASRNLRKALAIIDMILAIYPRSPEDVKQRALIRFATGSLRGSLNDLEDYMKMSPDAPDNEEVRETALAIRRSIAQMN
jgi:regulator of sirC expression with transglutaminase-like and TPR domain